MSDTADAPTPTVEHESPAQSPVEKPLPIPPLEDTTMVENTESVKGDSRPPLLTQSSSIGGKKAVRWRGKTCMIYVPQDDKRGSDESGNRLLTKADVKNRLQAWVDKGYYVHGFDVFAPELDSTTSQNGSFSRLPYPDQSEVQQESESQHYSVRFPNLGEWEAYVESLKEEKLRALGVSLGNDEPPEAPSPASMAALNQMAAFPGHITSPPIPTSSAASNHLFGSHTFSPHFNQSTNPSTNAESLASPPPQFGMQHPFYGIDGNIVAGFPYPYQATPPVTGTLTPQSLFNARQSNIFGTGPGGMPNLNAIFSPVSPLNADDIFNHSSNAQYDQRGSMHESVHRNSTSHDRHTRESRAATLIMDDPHIETEHFQASNVEIAHPTPRGHSHNLSETLQKGLDRYSQADYHLEQSMQGQLEDTEGGLQKSRWAVAESDTKPSAAHTQFSIQDSFTTGHHRMFGEQQQSMEMIQDADEIDTNPSLAASPREPNLDMSHHPWHSAKASSGSFAPGHKSKLSSSGLNVEAKEFNPTASFSSNAFAYQETSTQPNGYGNGSTFSPNSSIFKPSGSVIGFNVTAPSFTPFGNDNNVKNTSFVPNASKGFTFSAASFNADAPAFNPGASVTSNTSDAPSLLKSSIFGDVDFTQMSKPKKESKAIPIVRPDDDDQDKESEDAIESGARGPQPRQKRARRRAGEDEKDVEFAVPSPLAEASQAQATLTPQASKLTEGKENAVPEQDLIDATSKQASPDAKRRFVDDDAIPVKAAADVVLDEDIVPSVETEPFPAMSNEDSHASMRVDDEQTQMHKQSENEIKGKLTPPTPTTETAVQPAIEEQSAKPPKREPRKSIFSAFAKTFSFRPSISEFVPSNKESNDDARPEPVKSQPEKPRTGLFASRYAVEEEEARTKQVAPVDDKSQTNEKEQDVNNEADHDSPNEEELNAVMDQLNGDDSDVGVERLSTPLPPQETPEMLLTQQASLPHIIRSDAPSPSPGKNIDQLLRGTSKIGPDLDVPQSHNSFQPRGFASAAQSPVRQLLSTNEHISDWDDVISSGEDVKLVQRSKFFDRHVNTLVSQVLAERLGPLEQALSIIQNSVLSLHSQSAAQQPLRGRSADVEHSDADDEDDEEDVPRSVSQLNKRDRKLEKMKGAVLEALTTHGFGRQELNPSANFNAIHETLAELKVLAERQQQPEIPDIKGLIQEALAMHAQANARKTPLSEAEEIGAESLKLQLDGVKSMLRTADERTEQEIKARRDVQEALTEVQKMLGHAEGEVVRYRKSAEEAEATIRELQEEKIPQLEKVQIRYEALQKQQEFWEMTLSELSAKNIALENTLDEYRVTHDYWKKKASAAEAENKDLRSNITHLTARIEDSMRARQSLRGKFDKLQDDMVNLTRDVTREQANARRQEEELTAKYESLRASYDREVKLREKLEIDIGELEKSEREAAKLKFIFAQSQQENHRLEELVETLRRESQEHQNTACRFEREFNEARDSSRMEIQRTRTSMEADLEAANNQVNYVRAQLEAEIGRLESQIENIRMDADTAKERYELLLEEARENKASSIADISASKDMAMEEQRRTHDRVLNDLRERHARALHNASEDRQRIESHMNEKLELSNERIAHLQDRVSHLEERLEIAKSAARAAAQAAQAKGVSISPPPVQHHSSPSLSYSKDPSVPEKISPQALRESILVLQDQLQQRESRIEELEHELGEVDKDAPNKLKEKDTEISWLRELLGVRVDDLHDIITTLSQPSFDQNAVRDAAIRLRANLQMQQQEKERAMSGGPSFPSLSDIAASPRSLPLAAAAAWGNWRRGRESFTSQNGDSHTPSKSTSGGGFLSGLLTPPSSNVRYTPKNLSAPPGPARMGGRRTASGSRSLRGYNPSPRSLSARQMDKLPVVHQEPLEPPTTPPLLRRSSYDHDAEQNSYDGSALMDDGDGDSIIAPESPKGSRDDGIFATEE